MGNDVIDITEEALFEELLSQEKESSGKKVGRTSSELARKFHHSEAWVHKKLKLWKSLGLITVYQYMSEDLVGRPCKEYRYAGIAKK